MVTNYLKISFQSEDERLTALAKADEAQSRYRSMQARLDKLEVDNKVKTSSFFSQPLFLGSYCSKRISSKPSQFLAEGT